MVPKPFPRITLAAAVLAALLTPACTSAPSGASPAGPAVVPAPLSLEARAGAFTIGPATRLLVPEDQPGAVPVAAALKDLLDRGTGLDLPLDTFPEAAIGSRAPAGAVVLRLEDLAARLGPEGYLLDVSPDNILVRAAAPAGLFYGVQTLRQLLPPSVERPSGTPGAGPLTVPCVAVEDRPRFAWRGALLDCARHFFPKDFVLRWIDILALHKINTFQWHLTDDQGWRVEIKAYPRLTEVGAWRVDRESDHWNAREPQKPGEAATYGGFYTQDDIREVVAYAAARHITVVPEIEMPGHAKAALSAYPELSCTGGPFTVPPGGYWPITDVFCPGNERTFAVLADILAEVAALFPGPYVHIGGDEVDKAEWRRCPKCQARMKAERLADEKELQSYFVRRVERVLAGLGKRLVGWDEILEGGLAPGATVMSWRGTEGGVTAAKSGHDVVMSPTSHCYIDYYQGPPAHEPLSIGGYVPLSKVHAFEPVPAELTPEEAGRVLGGQVNLWTEYVGDGRHAEYMALPRLAALAEAVWSPKERGDWAGFAARVKGLFSRYDAAGLNAARSAFLVHIGAGAGARTNRISVALRTEIPGLDIRFATDGRDPSPSSKRYRGPFEVRRTTEVRAAAFEGVTRLSPAVSAETYVVHLASGLRPALVSPFSPKYDGGGEAALTDGLLGAKDASDDRWQGFEGVDLEAVLDLGRARTVRGLTTHCLQNINSWIFLPASVEFAVSEDGREFETVATVENDVPPREAAVTVKTFAARFEPRRVRFVRVLARSVATLPDWHYGAGGKAWLFADEIVVE